MKYPKGIKAVYDNGGKTADRYTIIFKGLYNEDLYSSNVYDAVAANDTPTHPAYGFYQHCSAQLGNHNGRKISWLSLPKSVRSLVNEEREYYG